MLTTELTLHLGSDENAIEVGLSKTLNNLTVDDLTDDIVNVGATDDRVEISSIWGLTATGGVPIAGDGVSMYSYEKNNYTGWYLDGSQGYSCGFDNAYHNGIYIRSMFALVGAGYQGLDTDIFTRNSDSVRLVTDMDISKVFLYTPMYDDNNILLTDETNLNNYVFNRYFSIRNKSDNGGISDVGYTLYNIVPVWLIVRDNDFVIWSGGMSKYFDNYGNRGAYGNGTTQDTKTFNADKSFSAQPLMYDEADVPIYADTHEYKYRNEKANYRVIWNSGGYPPYYWTQNAIITKEMNMNQSSWSGLFFKIDLNGKLYKPIISNGIVTGYTDDLSVESDIDNWTNINDHNISPTPPTPEPTDDDEIDDMKLGVGRSYSGMVKYYRLTPAQLLALSQEIQKETVVPAGYDVMKNIIALKRFPENLSTYADFSEPELIKLGSVTVPLSASQLAIEKKNISIGKYTIQGYHGTKENPHFLDFSPYTTAEVFIPYCGFVTIPTDKIMYNEIEVRLIVDVKLGNCTGVVKCNGNIVGQKAGVLSSDIPLVAVNMGVAMGAIVQGLMDTTIGFVSAIPYAAAGNTAATFSGVLNGTSALTQTIMSSKKNYTEVIGTTGGDIMFTMPDKCYIKITYPKKKLPDNYGKMVGYMCGKGGRLGDFNGFTICENVHVNVKATEEEKQMILEKLLTGVIMPYNG